MREEFSLWRRCATLEAETAGWFLDGDLHGGEAAPLNPVAVLVVAPVQGDRLLRVVRLPAAGAGLAEARPLHG